MKLVTQNPYRVLGLLGNSTERELQRQISTISRYAEVGKSKEFDYDFAFLGTISRTPDDVQRASSRIEQAANKIHHSLFWFVNLSHLDELALNNLKEKNLTKAVEIWNKTVNGEVTERNYSAALNLSTLMLAFSIKEGQLDESRFSRAIDLKGKLLRSGVFEEFAHKMSGNGVIDSKAMSEMILDDLYAGLSGYAGREGGMSRARFIEAFGGFSEDGRRYLVSKFTGTPRNNIETAIERAKEKRTDDPSRANEWGIELVSSTNSDLVRLKSILGIENIQYQTTSDKLANEILQCAIDYFVEWRDDPVNDPGYESLKVARFAANIVVSPHVKDRVDENIDGLKKWISGSSERKKVLSVKSQIDYINGKIEDFQSGEQSISRAKRLAINCKKPLNEIKSVLGSDDDFYIGIGTEVAAVAMSAIIDIVNKAQEYAAVRSYLLPNWSSLAPTIQEALNAVNYIGYIEMHPDYVDVYEENKRILSNINNQLGYVAPSAKPSRSTSSRSSSPSKVAQQDSTPQSVPPRHPPGRPSSEAQPASIPQSPPPTTQSQHTNPSRGILVTVLIFLFVLWSLGGC